MIFYDEVRKKSVLSLFAIMVWRKTGVDILGAMIRNYSDGERRNTKFCVSTWSKHNVGLSQCGNPTLDFCS